LRVLNAQRELVGGMVRYYREQNGLDLGDAASGQYPQLRPIQDKPYRER
jgi:hypothetical protein